MNSPLTREFITEALAESVADPRARALYELCFLRRDHLNARIVSDKLNLIVRLPASNGARSAFSTEAIAHRLEKSGVDHWFNGLRTAEDISLASLQELHARIMQVFGELPEPEARTLASRYLHFHFPELFCIYDASLDQRMQELLPQALIAEQAGADTVYAAYFQRCRLLCERLSPMLGRRLALNELECVLRAWHDHQLTHQLQQTALAA